MFFLTSFCSPFCQELIKQQSTWGRQAAEPVKVGDIHIQPTSRDFCDTPNQANPSKKCVYNFFEGAIKNSGSNIS